MTLRCQKFSQDFAGDVVWNIRRDDIIFFFKAEIGWIYCQDVILYKF